MKTTSKIFVGGFRQSTHHVDSNNFQGAASGEDLEMTMMRIDLKSLSTEYKWPHTSIYAISHVSLVVWHPHGVIYPSPSDMPSQHQIMEVLKNRPALLCGYGFL